MKDIRVHGFFENGVENKGEIENKKTGDLVTPDSDKNKILKLLYIQNSRKYKDECNEDLAILRYRISEFKKLAGTVSCNIHKDGNNLSRQNKRIKGFIKQNSDLQKFLEKNVCDLDQKSKRLKFDDSTLTLCGSMRETGGEAVEVGKSCSAFMNVCIPWGGRV